MMLLGLFSVDDVAVLLLLLLKLLGAAVEL